MPGVFSTGISGIKAAQTALDTISHNIANANTPGYARQFTQVGTQSPVRTGNGFVGSGVITTGIVSAVDQFLEGQLTAAATERSYNAQLSTLYGNLQQRISGDANGIGTAMSSLSAALSQASANPSSLPARQLVYAQADLVRQRFGAISEFIVNERQNVGQGLQNATNSANDLMGRIADLNDKIAKIEPRDSAGNVLDGQMANDMRAQRQQYIQQLGEYLDVQNIPSPEGETIISNGITLVIGNKASSIQTVSDAVDPTKRNISLRTLSGTIALNAEDMGGKIGALGTYLNEGLEGARASLDQLAGLMGKAINEQQAKGVDLYGVTGGNLFTLPSPTILPSQNNTGTAALTMSINDQQTVGSDYKVRFDAGQYFITRTKDDALMASGAGGPFTFDGITLNIAGASNAGDTWLLRAYGDAAGLMTLTSTDPKRLALASPVAVSVGSANTGDVRASAIKVTSGLPLNANLTEAVTITFTDSSTYTVSSASLGTISGITYVPDGPISYNGWQFSVSGTPRAGDSFAVGASSGNIGDGSNGNELLSKLTGKQFSGNTATLSDLFGLVQSEVGSKAGLADAQSTASNALYDIAKTSRESFSGVNLDEEAANLARWQQIYQANARVMSVAQDLFSQLIQSF